jgi:hypothetical protein
MRRHPARDRELDRLDGAPPGKQRRGLRVIDGGRS